MQKFITDVHTHSTFSGDGVSPLSEMLETALGKGVAFYGVSEHFNYDIDPTTKPLGEEIEIDEARYFHDARHLQEDYQGAMNVLIGAEFGYTPSKEAQAKYLQIYQKYRPDFIVNSIHCKDGWDYYSGKHFYTLSPSGERVLRKKSEVYDEYFALVEESLDVPYPYDIVGHLGYVARYFPQTLGREIVYAEHAEAIDRVLKKIIEKDKILETNAAVQGLKQNAVTGRDILERYYALGGRNVSYASDAHQKSSILRGREEIVKELKEIGFTHLTVPCRGEKIKVEL